VSQGWPVLFVSAVFCVGMIVWIARSAVHTQAMLASHHEQDWVVDAFVWINRQLTGRPPRQP
jgi:hypothetical protein